MPYALRVIVLCVQICFDLSEEQRQRHLGRTARPRATRQTCDRRQKKTE
jgi:hypothetical protein